jgi:SulP family sulfate permease
VSFSALSLGAAFGDQAHRGTISGVLSAGMLALITSAVGGTMVQCSGPTAPMTAVTVQLTEYAGLGPEGNSAFGEDFPGANANKFVNMVIVMSAALIFLLGICQVGKLIVFVPNVVVSGFMNGIAIMIWVPKVQELFGIGIPEEKKLEGNMFVNALVAFATTGLIFGIPMLTNRYCKAYKAFFPGTLLAIVLVTAVVVAAQGLGIQQVKTGEPISSVSAVADMFKDNIPNEWSGALFMAGLPFALNLAMLAYIDTLLTSRIVDAKVIDMYRPCDRWRPTNKALELVGQAAGNGFCALFGGIPGAQATIRSVLILNEGAMTRFAGICAGLFTIIEILLLQSLVKLIPQAVLTGVLFKVGYDCFDWGPFLMYINTQLLSKPHPGSLDSKRGDEPVVTHAAFVFIVLTAILNSFFSLTIVVGCSCVLYYIVDRLIMSIPDLPAYDEMHAIKDLEGSPDAGAPLRQTSAPGVVKGATPQRITSGAVERELSTASIPTSVHR